MQLTDAKLLNDDALMLMAYGHSDMTDMSGLGTDWRPPDSIICTSHSTHFLGR